MICEIPSWACSRWGQYEHDWLTCSTCLPRFYAYDLANRPSPVRVFYTDVGRMGLGINLGATEIIVDMVRDVGAPEMMFYKRHPAGARRGELEAKRIDDLFETAKSWAIIGPKGSYFCNGMIVDAPKLVRDGVAKHKWVLVTLEPRWIGDRTDWLAGDVSW